jgi:hypothetical protein
MFQLQDPIPNYHVHLERCPTAAWDMREFDLVIAYAGGEAYAHAG